MSGIPPSQMSGDASWSKLGNKSPLFRPRHYRPVQSEQRAGRIVRIFSLWSLSTTVST